MAVRSRSHRKHSHRRHRRHHTRKQRGGGGATGYGMEVNGLGPDQFARTFDVSGPYGKLPAIYVGAQGQDSHQTGAPTPANLDLIQSAGRKRRHRGHRGRKGGFIGPVIGQALAPAILLGLQQSYRRRDDRSYSRSLRDNRKFTRHHRK
jgi:hypothetical protein